MMGTSWTKSLNMHEQTASTCLNIDPVELVATMAWSPVDPNTKMIDWVRAPGSLLVVTSGNWDPVGGLWPTFRQSGPPRPLRFRKLDGCVWHPGEPGSWRISSSSVFQYVPVWSMPSGSMWVSSRVYWSCSCSCWTLISTRCFSPCRLAGLPKNIEGRPLARAGSEMSQYPIWINLDQTDQTKLLDSNLPGFRRWNRAGQQPRWAKQWLKQDQTGGSVSSVCKNANYEEHPWAKSDVVEEDPSRDCRIAV